MKENSPIWPKHAPAFKASCKLLPDTKTPMVPKIGLKSNSMPRSNKSVGQCSRIELGTTIMPTDTKKMAPNKFFIGVMRCSMRCASIVAPKIEPIVNAPSAVERFERSASMTIPRHSASDIVMMISSSRYFLSLRNNVGTRKIPPTNQSTRKNTTRIEVVEIFCTSWPPSPLLPLIAIVDKMTISKMPTISSMISTP